MSHHVGERGEYLAQHGVVRGVKQPGAVVGAQSDHHRNHATCGSAPLYGFIDDVCDRAGVGSRGEPAGLIDGETCQHHDGRVVLHRAQGVSSRRGTGKRGEKLNRLRRRSGDDDRIDYADRVALVLRDLNALCALAEGGDPRAQQHVNSSDHRLWQHGHAGGPRNRIAVEAHHAVGGQITYEICQQAAGWHLEHRQAVVQHHVLCAPGGHAPAQSSALLDHQYLVPGRDQIARRNQSGDTCADHRHPHRLSFFLAARPMLRSIPPNTNLWSGQTMYQ